jgi:predicted nuclease with TOPRIM domain
MTGTLSSILHDNNTFTLEHEQQKILDQLFEIINRVNESVDRLEQIQRSQAWTHQEISKLSSEIKQLKKGVINLQ